MSEGQLIRRRASSGVRPACFAFPAWEAECRACVVSGDCWAAHQARSDVYALPRARAAAESSQRCGSSFTLAPRRYSDDQQDA